MNHNEMNYPHKVECYEVNKNEEPQSRLLDVKIVFSEKQSKEVHEKLEKEYPGSWVVHTLID